MDNIKPIKKYKEACLRCKGTNGLKVFFDGSKIVCLCKACLLILPLSAEEKWIINQSELETKAYFEEKNAEKKQALEDAYVEGECCNICKKEIVGKRNLLTTSEGNQFLICEHCTELASQINKDKKLL